jgi:hypothetical protein
VVELDERREEVSRAKKDMIRRETQPNEVTEVDKRGEELERELGQNIREVGLNREQVRLKGRKTE